MAQTTRFIQKALAGFQDLLFGQGTVTQIRNGKAYTIDKINASNLPYSGDDVTSDMISIKEKLEQIQFIKGSWDFDEATGAMGNYSLGVLPLNSVITRAYFEVKTTLTSSGAATIALGLDVDAPEDLMAALAFDDAGLAVGYKDTLASGSAAQFTTKTTDERNIVLTIATADLTAGAINFWCEYIISE